eukprot:jgi/Galph1/4728/GphlegSOOS_G3365.1
MSEVSWEASKSDHEQDLDQKTVEDGQSPSEEGQEQYSPKKERSGESSQVDTENRSHQTSKHRQLYVGNLPPDATVPQIQTLFEEFKPISRVDLKSGFAFVFLENEEQAERAIQALNGSKKEDLFGFRTLKVEYAKDASLVKQREEERKRRAERNPTESLFVTNFPSYYRERDLEKIFEQFGKIVVVDIIRSYAFVTFASVEDATNAYEKMHHFTLSDGRELHVEYVTASRVGKARLRERRFSFRHRSPRRISTVSPSRRRRTSPPRSRSRSRDRFDKRRKLGNDSFDRRRSSPKYRSRWRSPERDRSPPFSSRRYSYRSKSPRRSPAGLETHSSHYEAENAPLKPMRSSDLRDSSQERRKYTDRVDTSWRRRSPVAQREIRDYSPRWNRESRQLSRDRKNISPSDSERRRRPLPERGSFRDKTENKFREDKRRLSPSSSYHVERRRHSSPRLSDPKDYEKRTENNTREGYGRERRFVDSGYGTKRRLGPDRSR